MADRENKNTAVVRRSEARRPVWDPWAEFEEVRERFDDLFGRAFGTWPFGRLFSTADAVTRPPIDLVETAEEFRLTAYLPGVPSDKVDLEVEPDRVTITAERPQAEEEEGVIVHLRGIGAGRFTAATKLPAEVVPDQAKATYRDGVLEVRLPKAEQARWRKPVKISVVQK
ncbi:MAG: Hsp20/alpha crystallin family protein [Armatimonadota bacterium]|nr:Hsp20/alpha crystallin family protein [Armatimonadota bacterium]